MSSTPRRHRHRLDDLQRIEALERQVAGQAAQIRALQRNARRREPTFSGSLGKSEDLPALARRFMDAYPAHVIDASGPVPFGADFGADDSVSHVVRLSRAAAAELLDDRQGHAADAFRYMAARLKPTPRILPWWRRLPGWARKLPDWLLRSKSCGDC